MADSWDIGEHIPLEATFADDDGVLFDGDVSFEFINPATDAVITFVWTESVPGTDIVRLGLGRFRSHIVPTHSGWWHWKYTCEGPSVTRIVESTDETAVFVRKTQF